MRLLIIGGTGNISRWIVGEIEAMGYDITLFNRHSAKKAGRPGDVRQIQGDRTDYQRFEKQMQEAGYFDCVIDMLGYDPEDAESALRCFAGKTGQYIFCSTVDVYSKYQEKYPVPLEQPIQASPGFAYAYKKMQIENILLRKQEESNFPLTIIRPGFTYSEGWSPLLTCFGGQSYHLDRILKKKPVILQDGGNMIWNCSHSADVAVAFAGAIGNTQTIGRQYNVTGDEQLSWKTMHEMVADLLIKETPKLVSIPTTELARLAPEQSVWCVENFRYNCVFDNEAAKKDLGYRYTISFKNGAERCLNYLKTGDLIERESDFPFYDEVILNWQNHLQRLALHSSHSIQ